MSEVYNYQSITNRVKRTFWIVLYSMKYIYKINKKDKELIQCSVIGELPEDTFKLIERRGWKTIRTDMYKLSYGKSYITYFYGDTNEEYVLSDGVVLVKFANSSQGMKDFLKYVFDLNPKIIRITDLVASSIISLVLKYFLKQKILSEVRGANYLGDFIMRDTSSFIPWLRARINIFLYSLTLKYSDLVHTTPVLAHEAEMLRKKADVYTSDWLLCMGSIPLLHYSSKDTIDNKYDFITNKYKNIIFTFSRVEKGKYIKEAIDIYLSIENKIHNSCFVVIGKGTYLECLKNMYSNNENIIFLGYMKREDAFPIVSKFNLFINPSGGYSLIEMGMLGVVSVSFNYDVMSILVYNNVNGYLVDKTTPEDIHSTILEYFNKSELEKNEMRDLCKKTFTLRFSRNAVESTRLQYTNKIFRDIF